MDRSDVVYPLGRLPFVSDRLLEVLRAEAHAQRPPDEGAPRRTAGLPGRALANVVVSRKLAGAIGDAVGFPVKPTYDAVYQYDPPGSEVPSHHDRGSYPLTFHLILEHDVPAGESGSALILEPEGVVYQVSVGDALVLRGQDVLHRWQPLGADERRTLIAIAFAPAEPVSPPAGGSG